MLKLFRRLFIGEAPVVKEPEKEVESQEQKIVIKGNVQYRARSVDKK